MLLLVCCCWYMCVVQVSFSINQPQYRQAATRLPHFVWQGVWEHGHGAVGTVVHCSRVFLVYGFEHIVVGGGEMII